jgi:hypothetical protein
MGSALSGGLRASPSDHPVQAPEGVGCVQRPSREHGRPAPRLRVRSFPATIDPAGTTTSADFSTASGALSDAAVPHHPASTPSVTGHHGTPAEISASKTNNLRRTPTAFTDRPLDGIGLRLVVQTRPSRPAFYAQSNETAHGPGAPCVPRVATSHSGFLPPSLTTERLPSACGWCHQPPQGTCTPELLVMSRAHRTCEFTRIRLSTDVCDRAWVMRAPRRGGRGTLGRRGRCAGSARPSDRACSRSTAWRFALPGGGGAGCASSPGYRA